MDINLKKKLAKEFLILATVILSSLLIGATLFAVMRNKTKEVQNLQNRLLSIQNSLDSLDSLNDVKMNRQTWLYSEFEKEYDMRGYSVDEFWLVCWKIYKADSIIHKWGNSKSDKPAFFRKIGFKTGEELNSFIRTNSIDSVSIQERRLYEVERSEIEEQLNEISQEVDQKKQLSKFMWISAGLFLIVFPLRYFLLAILWSIRTLKS